MNRLLPGTLALLIAILLAAPTLARAQTTEATSMVTGLTASLNSYDDTALGDLLTNDAILAYTSSATNIGGATYEGRDNILQLVPALRRDAVHYEIMGTTQVSESKVSWVWRETSQAWTGQGIDFVEYNMEGVVQGASFQSITFTFTEESITKIQEAVAKEGQTPGGMPRTGQGADPSINVIAMLIGVSLLSIGWAARRRTSGADR